MPDRAHAARLPTLDTVDVQHQGGLVFDELDLGIQGHEELKCHLTLSSLPPS
jgi:hypothetical protein